METLRKHTALGRGERGAQAQSGKPGVEGRSKERKRKGGQPSGDTDAESSREGWCRLHQPCGPEKAPLAPAGCGRCAAPRICLRPLPNREARGASWCPPGAPDGQSSGLTASLGTPARRSRPHRAHSPGRCGAAERWPADRGGALSAGCAPLYVGRRGALGREEPAGGGPALSCPLHTPCQLVAQPPSDLPGAGTAR